MALISENVLRMRTLAGLSAMQLALAMKRAGQSHWYETTALRVDRGKRPLRTREIGPLNDVLGGDVLEGTEAGRVLAERLGVESTIEVADRLREGNEAEIERRAMRDLPKGLGVRLVLPRDKYPPKPPKPRRPTMEERRGPHGTRSSTRRHRRNGEPLCEDCRRWAREESRRQRARQSERRAKERQRREKEQAREQAKREEREALRLAERSTIERLIEEEEFDRLA